MYVFQKLIKQKIITIFTCIEYNNIQTYVVLNYIKFFDNHFDIQHCNAYLITYKINKLKF